MVFGGGIMSGGRQIDRLNLPDSPNVEYYIVKQAKVDVASSGDNIIVPAVIGKNIRLVAQSLSVNADVTVTWKSGVGGGAETLIPARTFKAGGGIDGDWGPHGYYCRTNIGESLNLNLGGSVQVSGSVNYIEE